MLLYISLNGLSWRSMKSFKSSFVWIRALRNANLAVESTSTLQYFLNTVIPHSIFHFKIWKKNKKIILNLTLYSYIHFEYKSTYYSLSGRIYKRNFVISQNESFLIIITGPYRVSFLLSTIKRRGLPHDDIDFQQTRWENEPFQNIIKWYQFRITIPS